MTRESESLLDALRRKVVVLHESVWERKVPEPVLQRWLANFGSEEEQLHALYLLCHVMYFGEAEVREMLRSIYRDLFEYPVLAEIRRQNGDTLDSGFVMNQFSLYCRDTRFVYQGTAAESSAHLTYFFRQVNELSASLFVAANDILVSDTPGCANLLSIRKPFRPERFATPGVRTYVFIDDFCGSGSQAIDYSKLVVERAKRIDPDVKFWYFTMIATTTGAAAVRAATKFDRVGSVFEIDDSYKCFNEQSRYFKNVPSGISRDTAQRVAYEYGMQLWSGHPLGWEDGQLLLAFHHNTPDNTLPVLWADETNTDTKRTWHPIFKRYRKVA